MSVNWSGWVTLAVLAAAITAAVILRIRARRRSR
jgi:hypothetical protein